MDGGQKGTGPTWPRWAKPFLKALARTGVVLRACEAAKIKSRHHVYDLAKADPAFQAAWDEAREDASDRLEEEATRRAVEGVTRKKFTARGVPVIDPATGEQYVEYEYSDGLLTQLLKANRAKFRDQINLNHGGGINLEHGVTRAAIADPEASALAHQLLQRLAASQAQSGGAGVGGEQQDLGALPAPPAAEPEAGGRGGGPV